MPAWLGNVYTERNGFVESGAYGIDPMQMDIIEALLPGGRSVSGAGSPVWMFGGPPSGMAGLSALADSVPGAIGSPSSHGPTGMPEMPSMSQSQTSTQSVTQSTNVSATAAPVTNVTLGAGGGGGMLDPKTAPFMLVLAGLAAAFGFMWLAKR